MIIGKQNIVIKMENKHRIINIFIDYCHDR